MYFYTFIHTFIMYLYVGGAGTDALLSSFDSINVMRPPAAVARLAQLPSDGDSSAESGEKSGSGSWWHTDQAPTKQGLECVQGLLNMSPVGPKAGDDSGALKDLIIQQLSLYLEGSLVKLRLVP